VIPWGCVSAVCPPAAGPFNRDLLVLRPLIQQRQVSALVVGLPLDERQQTTAQAVHCRRYGLALAQALSLPLAWVNEHSSSWAAGERHGLHGDRSGRLDSAVAALLLEQWLLEGPEPQTQGLSTGLKSQPADAETSLRGLPHPP